MRDRSAEDSCFSFFNCGKKSWTGWIGLTGLGGKPNRPNPVDLRSDASLRNTLAGRGHERRAKILYQNCRVALCVSRPDARYRFPLGRRETKSDDRFVGTEHRLWPKKWDRTQLSSRLWSSVAGTVRED